MIQGDTYSPSLQDFDGARASFLKAEALLAPTYRATPDDSNTLLIWIQIEDSLADLLYQSGKAEEAARAYRKLLPLAHRIGRMKPGDVTSAKQEAFLHWRLAVSLRRIDPERGLEHANRQMTLMRALIARFPADRDLKQEFGAGMTIAAGALANDGDLDRAAEFYRQAIQLREELLGSDPNNVSLQRNLIISYGNYAGLLGVPSLPNLGRPAEARQAAARAVALARAMAAADPQDASARFNLAMSLLRLGSIEPESAADSLATLREAIAIMEPLAKGNPKSVNIGVNLATAREYAGHRLETLGKADDAATQYETSITAVASFFESGVSLAITQTMADDQALALLYASRGDRPRALAWAGRAVAAGDRQMSGKPTGKPSDAFIAHVAESHWVLASVHARFAEHDEARRAAQRALEVWKLVRNPRLLGGYRKSMEEAALLAAR
jgi:tetratricopeptide (TPR) repeat protein